MKILIIIFTFFLLASSKAHSLTPSEVYNDGLRAYRLGRWQQANESFSRFVSTWPSHKLYASAKYYKTVSSARNYKQHINDYTSQLAKEWQTHIKFFRDNLPGYDLWELDVAIKHLMSPFEEPDWSVLKNISVHQLKHVLNRRWYPDPSKSPIKTLKWVCDWLKRGESLEPEVKANLAYIKSRALWQIVNSPLAYSANINLLEQMKLTPIRTSMQRSLNTAFDNGSEDIRRKTALLGFHYEAHGISVYELEDDYFFNCKWLSYLTTRGLDKKEAWCPN